MARQKGVFKAKGTLDDFTFYKTQDGKLLKEKSGVTGERIATDPKFARLRENLAEFSAAAQAGKFLRYSAKDMMKDASDNRVISRLLKLMMRIKSLDTVSVRGSRTVGNAIADPAAKELLKGFNFNLNAVLQVTLTSPFTLDLPTGTITINDFVPINNVVVPPSTTHLSLIGAFAKVDFTTGKYNVVTSNIVNLPVDGTSTNVVLTPPAVPVDPGTSFYLLKVVFFQIINGVEYSLKNSGFNSMAIIEVA